MEDRNGYMSLDGLDEVMKGFEAADEAVKKAAARGLRKGAMAIVADAQDNLRENESVVTGLLRQSGRVQKVGDEFTVDAGFFDTTNQHSGYALYVEYGRPPGKMPPPAELEQWAYKKFQLNDRKAARRAGWALAIMIGRNGTEPHPFFEPAVRKNEKRVEKYIREEVRKVLAGDVKKYAGALRGLGGKLGIR
ncbi:MAG: HK97 gp10 family phage protein [Bacteroidales bacterium]|nr:HK97 gp10 family phage protein [Bacteroidales bacterium]